MSRQTQNQILTKIQGLKNALTLPNSEKLKNTSPPSLSSESSDTESTVSSITTLSSSSTVDSLTTVSSTNTESTSNSDSLWSSLGLVTFFSSNTGTMLRYLIVFLIIAFLAYKFFKPILQFLGYSAEETSEQVISTSIQGGEAVVEPVVKQIKKEKEKQKRNEKKSFIKYLDNENKKKQMQSIPEEDETDARSQPTKIKPHSGYCYIGKDKGHRKCISVNESDDCLSGDIFPTMDICINPRLRQ